MKARILSILQRPFLRLTLIRLGSMLLLEAFCQWGTCKALAILFFFLNLGHFLVFVLVKLSSPQANMLGFIYILSFSCYRQNNWCRQTCTPTWLNFCAFPERIVDWSMTHVDVLQGHVHNLMQGRWYYHWRGLGNYYVVDKWSGQLLAPSFEMS